MFNVTRIRYFYQVALLVSMQTMSSKFYCYNEDFNDVQSFHFIEWEYSPNLTTLDFPVRVGVNN